MNTEIEKNVVLQRCHCCKLSKPLKDFFVSKKGLINTFKCRKCWKLEFLEILRQSPM